MKYFQKMINNDWWWLPINENDWSWLMVTSDVDNHDEDDSWSFIIIGDDS